MAPRLRRGIRHNPHSRQIGELAGIPCTSAPDKFMALGATALQVWAMAANELKTLDREAIAKRIRGGKFKGTLMGDVAFEPNGQLGSKHYLFTVQAGKIVVQK